MTMADQVRLHIQERKAEIDGLRQQLSEFEESAEPLRAYALTGLREREGESGGVGVLDRDDAADTFKLPNWTNDWGSMQFQRCVRSDV